jgi:hypothetical protein
MGGRKQTGDFFRLFLVPGVHHGGGGPGLTEFDALTALENWVERRQAPEKLIAQRSSNGIVEQSRPVYPYPILAHYSGNGDPKRADSFVPFDPTGHQGFRISLQERNTYFPRRGIPIQERDVFDCNVSERLIAHCARACHYRRRGQQPP